ncbi:hypothetical protein AZA_53072 [Nitrospirillum viridazoti Y2]|uniref:hypothetical protein n=1 Tax=Nitrospirillum viridazoti TaxID=3144925 RepID=UPI0002265725|nr:hypothetical protein [Nitrospirillum amazonense]EGY02269.1 hypothetical protein AZA_53072 [Nitrospirillum amazonense Y2]
MTEAFRQVPALSSMETHASHAMEALTKAATLNSRSSILGTEIDEETARSLLEKPKQEKKGRSIDGTFTVRAIDTKLEDGHIFEFDSLNGNEKIDAEVIPLQVSADQIDLLWDASRNKTPVRVKMNAREVNGKIVRGYVMSVSIN